MIMMNNPAMSGAEPEGKLRLSYLNLYPGKSYNLHSVYLSGDSYFDLIHGGASFYLSDTYLGGIINDLRGGLSYAYFLKAGEDLYINAGLSASFYHRGYSFQGALLPDQIDPVGNISFPSGEALAGSAHTVFDVGAGFVITSGKVTGGISVSHLAEPSLSLYNSDAEKLHRKLLVHFSGDHSLNSASGTKISPVAFLEVQKDFVDGGTGIVFENRGMSLNTIVIANNEKAIDVQAGFSFTTGKMSAFYNYRFNLISGNNMLPFSLVLQAGLSFSINNFDKSRSTGAINFPRM